MIDRFLNAYRTEDLTKRDLTPPLSESIRLGSVLNWGVLLFFIVFAIWSVKAPIDEGASVEGSVTTLGNRKTVQHTLGGVVSKILVTEGQTVHEGEVLLQLNPLSSDANLATSTLQLINLMASEGRLRSERAELPAIQWPAAVERMGNDPRMVEAKRVQSKLFEARRDEYQTSLRTKKAQLQLLMADVKNAQAMAKEGLLPKMDANNMEREALRQEGELSQLVNARLSKIDSDLSEILGLKEGVQAKVQSLSFDRAQYDVRSPVDGIVSNLRINTLGGVVTPAQMLMDIVPKSLEYIVEAKVPTHLIGKIHVGMPANLRFTAFDPRTTPVVFGEVTLVGADKVASDKVVESRPDSMRADFYLVRIAVRDDLSAKLQDKPLQPGMPVDVIFKSGERPFLSYLLKPLSDQLSKSFLN